MWLFKSSALLILIAILSPLSGCGFKPLYQGSVGRDTALRMASIDIRPIADRAGQIMHNELRNLINPRGGPPVARYRLEVTYTETVNKLAVQKTSFATRANLRIDANFKLIQSNSKSTLISNAVTSITSYDIFSNEYPTLVAETDARKRAAEDAARAIATQVAAYFRARRSNSN